jgi:predicted TIM-barrel fold metal-dependent hydrolase
MHLHPERPRKETILAARDRILKLHPRLRVVGCHLGSMEDDVDDIARRFELYPNFAVDTAARVPDLMIQPREKVRAFLIQYQDRVLYATDLTLTAADKTDESLARWQETYDRDWTYFATSRTVAYEGRTIRGLDLPEPVLRKLFRANAEKWVPGIVKVGARAQPTSTARPAPPAGRSAPPAGPATGRR